MSKQAKTDRMSELKDFLVNLVPCMQSALLNASLNSSLNQPPKVHQDQPDTGDSLNDPSAIQTQTFQNSNKGTARTFVMILLLPNNARSIYSALTAKSMEFVVLSVRCSFCFVRFAWFVCLFACA